MEAKLKKKDKQNLTLMTPVWELCCQLAQIWSMTLPCRGALSHWWRVYGSQIKNIDKQNLTLMTTISKLCQLAQIWLMTLPWEHCPTCGVFMVAKLKKRQAKPNPNDSNFKTLSVGPNMVNDSPVGALSHWWRVYGSQIKNKDKQNLTLMTPISKFCQLGNVLQRPPFE